MLERLSIPEQPMRLVKERWYHRLFDRFRDLRARDCVVVFEGQSKLRKITFRGRVVAENDAGEWIINSRNFVMNKDRNKGQLSTIVPVRTDAEYLYFKDHDGKEYRSPRIDTVEGSNSDIPNNL